MKVTLTIETCRICACHRREECEECGQTWGEMMTIRRGPGREIRVCECTAFWHEGPCEYCYREEGEALQADLFRDQLKERALERAEAGR